MSKNKYQSEKKKGDRQQKTSKKPEATINPAPTPPKATTVSGSVVKPEQISLQAHQHIQNYLQTSKKAVLDKEDLNAVLRLSQHLRVFGLLSAVGYTTQSNAQEGKVRERTVPVWESLLGQLISPDPKNLLDRQQLREKVVEIARNQPAEYAIAWRKSLSFVNHWNFWARAYSKE